MAKSPNSGTRGARKALVAIVIAAVSVAGLALIAGGGYMLLAAPGQANLPAPISYVLAEGTSPTALAAASVTPAAGAVRPSDTPAPTKAPDFAATAAALVAAATEEAKPTATPPIAWPSVPPTTSLAMAEAPTATATRVAVMPTIIITPVASAVPGGSTDSQLPDTGFGEFLQPLAGFGLAGIALTAHLIRRRR
jgi:hypothetical protein